MKPARPFGADRSRGPALRLVGTGDATASVLLEQATAAERGSRRDLARDLVERAIQRAREPNEVPVLAAALLAAARLASAAGETGVALDILEAALSSATARGSHADCARAASLRSRVLWEAGDLVGAEGEAVRARDWAHRAGDVREVAQCLRTLGALTVARGDLAGGIALYETGLADFRALGQASELSATLVSLGELYDDARRWDASDSAFQEAASVAAGLGDPPAVLDAQLRHAELLARRGDVERAHAVCDRALETARRIRHPRATAAAARTAAMIARERGDLTRAEERLAAAEAAMRDEDDAILSAEIAAERAELYHRQDRHRETIVALNRAYRALSQLRGTAAVADLARRARRLESQFIDVVRRWGQSIEAKDLNTHGHCERVADLTSAIAQRMGVAGPSVFWYRVGALLHDIGKLVIPADLLNKPGRLSEDEWALVRRHPVAGAEMLADVDFPWDVRPIVECHHECWDGSGYPHGLSGERIPLAARIVCVADVYDVLTSDRSFKRALAHDEALEVMRRDVGRQFDPAVFRAFEEVVAEWTRPEPREGAGSSVPADTRAPRPAGAEDGLTGVLPRAAFLAAVTSAIGQRRSSNAPVSIVLVDVDDLARVNEAYGQLQGDDVLWAVARVLQHGLRGGDVIGRYGGDEFAILLPGAPLDVARDVARRLQAAVARLRSPVRTDPETTMAVTVSAGVASAPAHGDTAQSLVAGADRALFAARRSGSGGLASADDVDPRPAAPRMDLDRFVGRVDELRKLVAWLDAACRGDSRLVTVVGEAGIGKSTLLRQLEPEIRVRAGVLAVGQSPESSVKAPFAPWTQVIAAIARHDLVPSSGYRALARIAPALGTPATTNHELDANPYAVLEELVAYLRAASATRPLAIVLEDMQWADRASWDALEFVVAQLDGARMLVCATIRAEEAREVADRRRRLARSRGFAQISLRRLSPEELKRWLETVFHQGDIGTELPTFLHRYTEGNPLLVAQVLRALVDDGGLWYAGTRWEWRTLDQLQLPPACAQLVSRRIERLSPRAASIVAHAALLGRAFDTDLLVAAGAGEPTDIEGAVDEGVTAAVLVRAERHDGREYDFAHAVLADAARRAIPDRARADLHHRIARALELRTPTAVADIARHYHAAGDDREAFRYAMLAADRAASVHAHDEAAACLAVAQRHAPSADDLAAARVRHARVSESAGRLDQAEEMCDLALDHLASQGDTAATVGVRRLRERLRARRGQPVRRTLDACLALLAEAEAYHLDEEAVALHVMVSEAHSTLGDPEAAERSARRAVRLSAARGDRRGHAEALLRLGASLGPGRLEETLDRYREALALFIRLNDRRGQTRCWLATGEAHAGNGRLSAAREALEVALDTARQAHAPDLAAVATFSLGTLDFKAGALGRARDRLDDALRLFTTVRDEARRAAVLLVSGHVARDDGRAADAITAYDAAAARATELDDEQTELAAEASAGLVALDQGDVGAAEARLRVVDERLAGGTTPPWFAGRELLDALAIRLAAAAGHLGVAAERFERAFALAEPNDPFASAQLVAECAATLAGAGVRTADAVIDRVRYVAIASGFDRLAARLKV